MECISTIQREYFNCTDISFPRTKLNSKICYNYDKEVYSKMYKEIEHNILGAYNETNYSECNCLPLCNTIEYDLNVLSINDSIIKPTNSM